MDEVEWIEASRDYAVLHTDRGNHVVRQTMAVLERGLDPAAMLRVHRSASWPSPRCARWNGWAAGSC